MKLTELSGLNFLLEVNPDGLKLSDWAKNHQLQVRTLVKENKALLIRGLNVYSSKQFGEFLCTIFDTDLEEYVYRSTPRTKLKGNVYTATEYPANEVIPQHNENAYSRNIPNHIGFCCLLPSTTGGQTPISDSRIISDVLTDDERQKFEVKGIMYVRNYSELDLPWQEVFQTTEKSEVEAYCEANDINFEWLEDNKLRTKQTNPAFVNHPVTEEKLWLNQAHLFHVSNLPKEVSDTLMNSLGEDNLPRNTYYGDGTAIEPGVITKIRQAYQSSRVIFDWQKSDILLLDNYYFTHGREPYSGPRKILAGLA